MFSLANHYFCEERAKLTDQWLSAAQQHADALTDFSRSADLARPVRIPEHSRDLGPLRIAVEKAINHLDTHRSEHG